MGLKVFGVILLAAIYVIISAMDVSLPEDSFLRGIGSTSAIALLAVFIAILGRIIENG